MQLPRKIIITYFLIFTVLVGFSVWWGGRNILRLNTYSNPTLLSENELKELTNLLEEELKSSIKDYNLGAVYFQKKQYEKAKEHFEKLLNDVNADSELIKNGHFNLGNTYFRLAELEKDVTSAISLLQKSLIHYRWVLDYEKRKTKYSGIEQDRDEDVAFNYTLTKTRIKVLNDMLQKQQNEQANQKNLYQILVELKKDEQRIADELQQIKTEPYSGETIERRDNLLKLRKKNLDKLNLVKDRLLNSIQKSSN